MSSAAAAIVFSIQQREARQTAAQALTTAMPRKAPLRIGAGSGAGVLGYYGPALETARTTIKSWSYERDVTAA